MKNLSICIVDSDTNYIEAFARVLAFDHAGHTLVSKKECAGDCQQDFDLCLNFDGAYKTDGCQKMYEPRCGKYEGVCVILAEIRAFLLDQAIPGTLKNDGNVKDVSTLNESVLVCVYACAGGIGTGCASIGLGREFARYRGEKAIYISLEDVEDRRLYPLNLTAMCAEESIYRYLRLLNSNDRKESYTALFEAAASSDEYGLFRFAPDDGLGSFARFTPAELYIFLQHLVAALDFERVILDFGTRLHYLTSFANILTSDTAVFVETLPESPDTESPGRKRVSVFENDHEYRTHSMVFPFCKEDIRSVNGCIDVGLANSFGLAVKNLCDQIRGDVSIMEMSESEIAEDLLNSLRRPQSAFGLHD